jgi:hypothetical protein
MDKLVKTGQTYELVKPPLLIDDLNDMINQAIVGVSEDCLQNKVDSTVYTERDRYQYSIPSGFVGVYQVDYYANKEDLLLHDCESVWTAGAATVTVSLDTQRYRVGSTCNKLDIAAGLAAVSIIAYATITSVDISAYDKVEFWLYSTVACAASDLGIQIGTPSIVYTYNLPAITANTWTRCSVTITYPEVHTGVTRVQLYQTTDIGACIIWIDSIKVVKSGSKEFKPLNRDYWTVTPGSTNYLNLTSRGKSITGDNTCLRISGYDIPAALSADTSTSEVDPDYIINKVSGMVLAKMGSDHKDEASYYLAMAEKRLKNIQTVVDPYTRML